MAGPPLNVGVVCGKGDYEWPWQTILIAVRDAPSSPVLFATSILPADPNFMADLLPEQRPRCGG